MPHNALQLMQSFSLGILGKASTATHARTVALLRVYGRVNDSDVVYRTACINKLKHYEMVLYRVQ